MEQYPKRKSNRLEGWDYSQAGCYFVTVCTQNRESLFWDVGAAISRPEKPSLSPLGKTAEQAIRELPLHYPHAAVEHYVVMPNHVHLLVTIGAADGRILSAPTKSLSTMIAQMKRVVSKAAGRPIWQKSYHDHIIRSETDFLSVWNYITGNPSRWSEDICYESNR